MASANSRSERINLRVDPETKDLLKRAAAAENRTVTSFILNAAQLRAETVLEPTDRLILTNEEFRRFLDEVESSPDASDALRRAVRRSAERGLSTSA
jgi:uncharacterized protein (DUF1778 family)